jgi:hypothetical protein
MTRPPPVFRAEALDGSRRGSKRPGTPSGCVRNFQNS